MTSHCAAHIKLLALLQQTRDRWQPFSSESEGHHGGSSVTSDVSPHNTIACLMDAAVVRPPRAAAR